MTFPTVYRLLERYCEIVMYRKETHVIFYLARYLTELTLIDVKMNKWAPYRIASACLYLAKKMLRLPNPWGEEIARVCNLTEKQVRECAREICILINLAHQRKVYEPIFKKYSICKYYRVAQIPVKIRQEAAKLQKGEAASTTQTSEAQDPK